MQRHKRPSTFKLCHTCGALYTRKAKWCPYCRDDQGHLKAVFTPQVEVAQAEPTVHIDIRPRRKPLVILTEKVKEIGYLPNVRDIATGKAKTQLPVELAREIIHEADGWHTERICTTCTYPVQQAAAAALRIIFGQAVQA